MSVKVEAIETAPLASALASVPVGGSAPFSPMPLAQALADVPIGGIAPFSTADWPGQLAATLFTRGCPWRCTYCHNPELLARRGATIDPHSTARLLLSRKGLLDAVVISGGEPTLHAGLPALIRALRGAGFLVGLHTNGMFPPRLRALLARPETAPDWIGLDVKTLPDRYPTLVAPSSEPQKTVIPPVCAKSARLVAESLDVIVRYADGQPGFDFEARTTVARCAGGLMDPAPDGTANTDRDRQDHRESRGDRGDRESRENCEGCEGCEGDNNRDSIKGQADRITVPSPAALTQCGLWLAEHHVHTWAIQRAQGDTDPGADFATTAHAAQAAAVSAGIERVLIRA